MLTRLPTGLTYTGDADRFLEREWLLTNATGSFAMGTALGANTRRYHGLLVAAARPPVGRVVVLHHLVEQLVLTQGDGSTHTLEFGPMLFSDDKGQRVVAPDDTDMLQRFDHGLSASWSYAWQGMTFTRRLVLHDDAPSCTVHYDLSGLGAVCESAELTLRPMVTLRDFHMLQSQGHAEYAGGYGTDASGDTLRVRYGGLGACYRLVGASVGHEAQWWSAAQYPIEQRRGQGEGEDLYAPAVFTLPLPATDDATADFTATLGDQPAAPMAAPTRKLARLDAMGAALLQHAAMARRAASPPPSPLPSREGPGEGRPIDPATTDGKRGDRPSPQPPPSEGGGAGSVASADGDLETLGPQTYALARAADDFVVQRRVGGKTLSTIIAGYPWFADWGRDTFIALPGLLLCTGRHDEARDTLAAFAAALRDGLVPNRFDDDDPTKAHYNTVDASLWFVHSALEYLRHTGDRASWDGWLAGACVAVAEGYRKGTHADAHDGTGRVTIAMQDDGLIAAGNAHSQLTWMDAAAPDGTGRVHVFTPRPGKCVEINALWYSALVRLGDRLPDRFERERSRYAELAPRVAEAFTQAFWGPRAAQRGYLTDHLAPHGDGGWVADAALRPNLMIACALEHSPVQPAHAAASIAAVRGKLLTHVGLRTLPRDDPDYHAQYDGPAFERDGAYHRGTVWPWLIGPYAEAVLRTGNFSDDARREARDAIAPLLERLTTTKHPGALGQLHEIHAPEPPFAPRGCPAQAWSVAEVLRVWVLLNK